MSDESKREKQIIFERIRENANVNMRKSMENYSYILKELGFKNINLPNIIITYNNKIIALEKEFAKCGIDFYDRFQCNSRFILDQYLQVLILKAKDSLNHLNILEEELCEYLNSYKKITFFNKIFKGAKYQPKTPVQEEKVKLCINDYIEYNRKIEEFSIEKDIIDAILVCRALSLINGVTDFDERIEKINFELTQLGYNSISDTVKAEIEKQNSILANMLA